MRISDGEANAFLGKLWRPFRGRLPAITVSTKEINASMADEQPR
jgi:hypothetical protein